MWELNYKDGLDVIDTIPDELWMEVCDIVQETGIKTIPKKCTKAKWLSEEVLQIAVKRREAKEKRKDTPIWMQSSKELPDVQAGFRKGRGTEIKLPTSAGSSKNWVPEEHLLLLYWLCQSLWLYGSQQTVENSSRDGNTRPPDLPPEKSVCRSRSNS